MRKDSEKPLLMLVEAGRVNDMPVIVPAAAPKSSPQRAWKRKRPMSERHAMEPAS